MPALMEFSLKNGFNPITLGMLWSFSMGGKVFVYQSSVLDRRLLLRRLYGQGSFQARRRALFRGVAMLIAARPLYWPLLGLTFR